MLSIEDPFSSDEWGLWWLHSPPVAISPLFRSWVRRRHSRNVFKLIDSDSKTSKEIFLAIPDSKKLQIVVSTRLHLNTYPGSPKPQSM